MLNGGKDCDEQDADDTLSPLDTTFSTIASESDAKAMEPLGFAFGQNFAKPLHGSERGIATISGVSGKYLAEELRKWMQNRKRPPGKLELARNGWEKLELTVAAYYDSGPVSAFINVVYDILQLSSGRDKLCALLQGYAKIMSAMVTRDSERYFMYRGMEDSLSDGRKIFRLFKEFREVYKVRRGFHRMQEGIAGHGFPSIAAVCGAMDVLGHTASFFYYVIDNILWAASVGIFRTKEIPRWQIGMWKGFRKNGPVINYLGGVTQAKKRKNMASIWRLNFAITANVLLLIDAIRQCRRKEGGKFQGPDDPRLFHTLELIGMAASYRVLVSKLNYIKLKSHATSGVLAIVAALCGIWSNWRKVRRKKFGTKAFVTVVDQREKIRRSSSLGDIDMGVALAFESK